MPPGPATANDLNRQTTLPGPCSPRRDRMRTRIGSGSWRSGSKAWSPKNTLSGPPARRTWLHRYVIA